MDTLLQISLTNAVAATLLALIVGCIGLVCRRPALMHCLWLLVLLKLVTPPLVLIPVEWPAPARVVALAPVPPVEATPASDPLSDLLFDQDAGSPFGPETAPPVLESVAAVQEPADTIRLTPTNAEVVALPAPPLPVPASAWWAEWWQTVVVAVWLTGSALWYLCAAWRLRRFQGLLRHAHLAPVQLQKRTERLAKKLDMAGAPTVYLVPGRLSPLLWAALGAPRLVLPAGLLEQIDDSQRDTLILHELAHLRRRDHWVRALEFVVMGLYWWHPVIWFVRRELREAEEQCCDAWVVSSLPEANRTYATALVETIDFLSAVRSPVPLLASGVGPISDLKRRLTMIMRGTTPRTLSWRGMLMVLALGALLLPLLPLLPATARADDKKAELQVVEGQPQTFDLSFTFEDSPEGQAELAKLKAQLEQKMKEIQETQAKIKAIRSMLQTVEGGKPEAAESLTLWLKGEKGADGQQLILRKIGDKWEVVDPKTLRRPMKPGEEPRPGQPLRAGFGQKYFEMKDGKATAKPTQDRPASADTDRRIDQLEMKLEKILQQIEQMQKDLKGSRQGVILDREAFEKLETGININPNLFKPVTIDPKQFKPVTIDPKQFKPPTIDPGFFPNQDGAPPAVIDPKALPKKNAPLLPTPPPVLDPGFGPNDGGNNPLQRLPGLPVPPAPPVSPPPATVS